MAGLQTRCSPRQNVFLGGEDEPAGRAFTKSSNIYTFTSAVLCALTSASALALLFIDELFKQFMKAYLEAQTQLA